MKSTKAPAVKAYLLGIAQALPVMAEQQFDVTFGWPSRLPERRWVVAGDTTWDRSEWVTNRSREESFRVLFGFCVLIKGGSAQEAEECASLVAASFEDALRADPGLGGLAVTSSFEPRDLKSWPVDSGFEAQFQTEVSATCRP